MATQHSHTNCRDDHGVTVGLIDGIIAMARVLRNRNLQSDAVQEALADLRSDEDIEFIFTGKALPEDA